MINVKVKVKFGMKVNVKFKVIVKVKVKVYFKVKLGSCQAKKSEFRSKSMIKSKISMPRPKCRTK